jgi:hypothetical protein
MITNTNTNNLQNYYQRDLTKTVKIENEDRLLLEIVGNALLVSQEVTQLFINSGAIVNPKNVRFKITKELFIRLIEPSKKDLYTPLQPLSSDSVNKVKTFFEETNPSIFFDLETPHKTKMSQEKVHGVWDLLEHDYRQHNNWFKKIPLLRWQQDLSCYAYAIVRSGIEYQDFLNFGRASACDAKDKPLDYIGFLKSQKMEKASLPLQSGDILVYFNGKEMTHAALVANNPKMIYAKLGIQTPYAYRHHVDETPLMYGNRFQIFRKK